MNKPSFKDRISACKEKITQAAQPIATAAALASIAGSAQAAVTIYNINSPHSYSGWAFDPLDGSYETGIYTFTASNPIAIGACGPNSAEIDTTIGLFFAAQTTSSDAWLISAGTVIDGSDIFTLFSWHNVADTTIDTPMYLAFKYTNPSGWTAGDYYGWVEYTYNSSDETSLTRFAIGGLNEPVIVGQASAVPEPTGTLATSGLIALSLSIRRRGRKINEPSGS